MDTSIDRIGEGVRRNAPTKIQGLERSPEDDSNIVRVHYRRTLPVSHSCFYASESDRHWTLFRPLRVRLEQVLVSQHEPVTLYKLTNLLKFYETTVKQLLPLDCQLVLVLDEVSHLSSKMFLNAYVELSVISRVHQGNGNECRSSPHSSLNATATRLIEKVDIPTSDLNLSDELRRTLALLRDILDTHSTSMIPFESKRVDFQQIVYSIIDPLLQMCSLSAAKLGVIEMSVYLVNCVSAIRTTLAVFAFTDEKIEMLEGQVGKRRRSRLTSRIVVTDRLMPTPTH